MKQIEECESRVAIVTTGDAELRGVVTDGDIRRGILDGLSLEAPVKRMMSEDPIVRRPRGRGPGRDRPAYEGK